MKPTILTFVNYYLPGYKAGGPLRTVANMVEQLSDEFTFKILTLDRDQGDTATYEGVTQNQWHDVGLAPVYYFAPEACTLGGMREVIRATEHDVLYFNSFFHPIFTMKPLLLRRLGRIESRPVVIAPRGEFSPGALAIRKPKKMTYITLARLTGLYRDVIWQASTEHEEADVRRQFGDRVSISVAKDLSVKGGAADSGGRRGKQPGSLDVIFVSRVSPKKNVAQALELLAGLRGRVRFNIYGDVDDHEYWEGCRKTIRGLPPNVEVSYRGSIPHEEVLGVMSEHDLFFLPTLGENFGHVIQEALLAACPVLISDRTPWRNLEAERAGWDLPLEDPDAFRRVLQELVDMDAAAHESWSAGALEFGRRASQDAEAVDQNRALFRLAASVEPPPPSGVE